MEEEIKFIPNIEKLLGLTVDITLFNNNNKISGNIFIFFKLTFRKY